GGLLNLVTHDHRQRCQIHTNNIERNKLVLEDNTFHEVSPVGDWFCKDISKRLLTCSLCDIDQPLSRRTLGKTGPTLPPRDTPSVDIPSNLFSQLQLGEVQTAPQQIDCSAYNFLLKHFFIRIYHPTISLW